MNNIENEEVATAWKLLHQAFSRFNEKKELVYNTLVEAIQPILTFQKVEQPLSKIPGSTIARERLHLPDNSNKPNILQRFP